MTFTFPIRDTSAAELQRATLAYMASFQSINGSREGPEYESIRASLKTIVHDRHHSNQGSNYTSHRFQDLSAGAEAPAAPIGLKHLSRGR